MLFVEQTTDREMIVVEGERLVSRKQPMSFNEFVRIFQFEFAQIIRSGRQLYVVLAGTIQEMLLTLSSSGT